MKVLVVDKFPESGIHKMRSVGCEVLYQPEVKGDALLDLLRSSAAKVLVVRSTKVTAPMLDAGQLSLVVRAGSGYDTIDVAAASARGVYVSNCPGKNSTAVAELAFGLILALDRRIADNVIQLRAGQWNKKEFSQARGLYGRTLGIIGIGQIGREMIKRAQAFGMPIVAWSRSLTPARAQELGITHKSSPEDVAAAADIVSVHLALTLETKHLIGEKFFRAMKPGAYFINTARAEVVDYAALERAIREKGIRAGLDVYAKEPAQATGAFDDGLAKLDAVYGTHHIGASTEQAQEAIAEETVRIIQTFKHTGQVPNLVNREVAAMANRPDGKAAAAGTGVSGTGVSPVVTAQTAVWRVYNFNPGPATLPVPALEEAQRDLVSLPGEGMSVLEISHRSKRFEAILAQAEANLRKLLNIPENYQVLFLQGGASLQFSMVPMNLLPRDGSADYINTGHWADAAIKEAKKVGRINIAASTESEKFSRIPRADELKLDPKAAYVHFTSNNTIEGTQWPSEPAAGDVRLVCDASSDICSRGLDIRRYGILYAGAQKNLGPAGVTVVIIRDDLLARTPSGLARQSPQGEVGGLPVMLDYQALAKGKSLYNTPPVFAIYMVELVTRWLLAQGGLEAVAQTNERKAKLIYDAIDSSNGFYRGTAEKGSRSRMNITFRLTSESAQGGSASGGELEEKFVKEATAAGLHGLKGHRSVGGIRASMFNAFPLDGAHALATFMADFAQKNG